MAAVRSIQGYREWLEREGTTTVLIYSALIVVLLPAFHYFLAGQPTANPDSMALRLSGAACAAAVALAILLVRPLRQYSYQMQFLNVMPTLFIVLMLVVNSGNNAFYVASGLLVVVGMQQAFFRVRDMFVAFGLGLVFQIGYSLSRGLGQDHTNTLVILIYASAYAIAIFPGIVNIRTRERSLAMRFEAESARAEVARQLARQTIINRIVEYIRSTFDLQDVTDNVVQALGPQLDADRIILGLWQQGPGTMVVRSEYRRDPLSVPSLLRTELKSARWLKLYRALLAGQTLHLDAQAGELGASQREFLKLTGTREFMVVPISAQNRRKLLGFMSISHTVGSALPSFDEEDASFLEAIAGQVAIAIQQSRVYEQLQEELDYRRRQEARLADLANRDPLTGIFNRRYFMEEVERCVERCNTDSMRGALFFLDLDHFKIVNDTLGHDAGDRVLLAIPKVIRTALRESDLLARIGGDEFAVLLPDIKQSETLRVAEKIRKCIAGYSFRESGRSFDLGVSIGVALIDGKTPPGELLGRADEACYKAKAEGRDSIRLWSATSFA